jgi:hypothetical protein
MQLAISEMTAAQFIIQCGLFVLHISLNICNNTRTDVMLSATYSSLYRTFTISEVACKTLDSSGFVLYFQSLDKYHDSYEKR